jgi:hypothetical protein
MSLIVLFSGVLKETVEAVKVGASVRELCSNADKRLEEETGKAFKKDKKLVKGNFNKAFKLTECLVLTMCFPSPIPKVYF